VPELSASKPATETKDRPRISAGPPSSHHKRWADLADRLPGGFLVMAVPAIVAFVFGAWGATAISYDRDEVITVSMARRPVWTIVQTLRFDDVVHGVYYLTEHVVFLLFGDGELALRMPSLLATMVGAAATAALGRRLISPLGGLLAGLLFAMTPTVGHYSHFARSYAIVAALATVVTLLFVRALERDTRRGYVIYAVGMAALGMLHFFALLLIVAHVLTLAFSREHRSRLVTVAVACGCAVIPAVPVILIARHQQSLISWAKSPGLPAIGRLVLWFTGGATATGVVIVLVLCGVIWGRRAEPPEVASGDRDGARVATSTGAEPASGDRDGARGPALPEGRTGPPVGVRELALPWLIAPPAILLLVSQVHPVYASRYVLLCIPAVALLAAAGAVRLPYRLGPVAVLVAVALMMPLNIAQRRPTDTLDQFRESAQVVHRGARPGDVVIFVPKGRRAIEDAYPADFAGIANIAQLKTPSQAHNLTGTEVSAAVLRRRFETVQRAWLVGFSRYVTCKEKPARGLYPDDQVKIDILTVGFQRAGCWPFKGMTVRLYIRR
jgi:mannosyltransferase